MENALAAALMPLKYGFDAPIPSTVAIGRGSVLLVRGWIAVAPGAHLQRIEVDLGGQRQSFDAFGEIRWDVPQRFGRPCGGLFLPIRIEGSHVGATAPLRICAIVDGRAHLLAEQQIAFTDGERETIAIDTPIAICLATYNPDIALLSRQLESIRAQTRRDWTCIIHDDASKPERVAEVEKLVAGDARFRLFRSATNRGFYGNFEAALALVPSTVPYVALSDQDDTWHPDKLEALIRQLEAVPGAQLVYSDMRIVDPAGGTVSETYWSQRRNNYTSFDTLLFANTVTGAASLFRGSMLDAALPFPPRVGHTFHDHWLACCAVVGGGLTYVDRPLYDYTQHGGNVIGHCDFGSLTPTDALVRHARNTAEMALRPSKIADNLWGMLAYYHHEYRRLQVVTSTLALRFPDAPDAIRRTLSLFDDRLQRAAELTTERHLKVLRRGDTTDMAEFKLGMGLLLHKTVSPLLIPMIGVKQRLSGLKQKALRGANAIPDRVYDAVKLAERAQQLEEKIAPLNLVTSVDEPVRVNILIPEINFANLFGGYLGKFQLALRLTARGHRVRLVVVDHCVFDPDAWERQIKSYPGIEDLLRKVEIAAAWPRAQQRIVMNPKDAIVATTFWTAHIADAATRLLARKHFVYLIQEYEPLTFPMGSWHALADESYRFPHRALFSTRQLRDWFRDQRLGVFAADGEAQAEHRFFENAIAKARPDWQAIAERKRRKLLFYCRPQAHAARNMFELALCALNRAIADGAFDDGDWSFEGVGADRGGHIDLACKRTLTIHERMSYADYLERLPEYDLGLSLMDTPHPSLVPLEMAAAGMIVVTTTCANKTSRELQSISTNVLGYEPSITRVAEGLGEAAKRVSDIDARRAGSDVHWAGSWDESFRDEVIEAVDRWISD